MVLRAAEPNRGRDERIQSIGNHPGKMVAEQGVGGQRQVRTVLLRRAERDHNRVPPTLF